MNKPVIFSLYLDRVEEEVAILLFGVAESQEIKIPAKFLPSGFQEGHWLNLQLTPDPTKDALAQQQNQDLMTQLMSAPKKKQE